MSVRLGHSIKLIIVSFMCVIIVWFFGSFIQASACQHPLMSSFIGNRATQTGAFVNLSDRKSFQQRFVYKIACLYVVVSGVRVRIRARRHQAEQTDRQLTSDMLMSFFTRDSKYRVRESLRSSCLSKKPDVKRPRLSGLKLPCFRYCVRQRVNVSALAIPACMCVYVCVRMYVCVRERVCVRCMCRYVCVNKYTL